MASKILSVLLMCPDIGLVTCIQGVTELPDYNKIMFSEMPPIPLEEIVPDASPMVNIATDG